MAGLAGTGLVRYGKGNTWDTDMDHIVHDHHLTHSTVRLVLDEPNVHDELHYAVCNTYHERGNLQLTRARMLIVLAFASMVSWIVRYRFLNMYARLPPEPQRKEPQIDLFPDTQDGDSKPGLANYLDEFLSAIKVFGYREYGAREIYTLKTGCTDIGGSRTLRLPRTHPDNANQETHCWRNIALRRGEGILFGG